MWLPVLFQFVVELEEIVDAGDLTPEDPGPLQEICEPLHISPEKASMLLEQTVNKRNSAGVLQAAALLRQQRHGEVVKELDRVLKFAALIPNPKAESPAVSKAERQELYLIYEADSLAEDNAADVVMTKLALLRETMGLDPVEV